MHKNNQLKNIMRENTQFTAINNSENKNDYKVNKRYVYKLI